MWLQLTYRNSDEREADTIPRSKIVDERLIAKVKALREESKTQEEIAAELGVVQSTVSAILRRGGLGGRLISARRLRR
jgi:IS30 family transposase